MAQFGWRLAVSWVGGHSMRRRVAPQVIGAQRPADYPQLMDEARRDRARVALIGLACGDAVGTTVEFRSPGSFEPLVDMVGCGPFALPVGAWTDDTSMALCLAESLIDQHGMDLADQMRRYLMWRSHGYLSSTGTCFDIGGTVSSQLTRFRQTGEAVDPRPNEDSAANGSLMRLAPVPIFWHGDVAEAAERSGESSRNTHAAQRPVDACRLMGAMVAALIEGRSYEEVSDPGFWVWGELHPQIAAIAAGSFRSKEPPEIRGSGFCADALEAALWAVDRSADFRQAVLAAANLGDDADTTAAIAGQLAGARWGYKSIPALWRSALVMGHRLRSLADRCFEQGSSESGRWQFDGLMHAWWAVPGQVLAGEYPTTPDGGAAKIQVLLDAGIRTFIDLTRADDHLTPYAEILRDCGERRGLDVRHRPFPIQDQGVIGLDGYREIVQLIEAEVAAGRVVFVHCWGGVGRTGTVIGCLLAERAIARRANGEHAGSDTARAGGAAMDPGRALTVDDIVEEIASLRDGTRKAARACPSTEEQRDVIAAWIARGARF